MLQNFIIKGFFKNEFKFKKNNNINTENISDIKIKIKVCKLSPNEIRFKLNIINPDTIKIKKIEFLYIRNLS